LVHTRGEAERRDFLRVLQHSQSIQMEEPIKVNAPEAVAEKGLRKLERLAGVSSEALDAFVNLCNPFPDSPVVRRGWPDSKASPSVVLVDTYETTLSQPDGLPAGVTWDAHVNIAPIGFESTGGGIMNLEVGGGWTATGSCDAKSTLNIAKGQSGSLPTWKDIQAEEYDVGSLAQGSSYRIVAQGLEIINITADLYKGGMAYGYRYSTPKTPYSIVFLDAPANLVSSGMTMGMPPDSIEDIVNYGNTYEGMAKDGVYVINAPDDFDNEPGNNIAGEVILCPTPGSLTSTGAIRLRGTGKVLPWCHAGAFLVGLAQGSSFVIRLRTYIEIFPQPRDGNNLIRLTNPTVSKHDTMTELISEVLKTMPAGCAYIDNPLGEWFNRLMSSIETFAPMVGSALSTIFPPAALIGQGLGVVAKGARKMNGGKQLNKEKAKGTVNRVAPLKVHGVATSSKAKVERPTPKAKPSVVITPRRK